MYAGALDTDQHTQVEAGPVGVGAITVYTPAHMGYNISNVGQGPGGSAVLGQSQSSQFLNPDPARGLTIFKQTLFISAILIF